VRNYGFWKWCCSYIVCHKPIIFGHLVGDKLYFTIIMTLIPIKGKSKSYKHKAQSHYLLNSSRRRLKRIIPSIIE